LSRVFIASAGYTNVGKLKDKGIGDLMAEASLKALSGCPDVRPDRVVVGNMFSGVGSGQEHLGAYLSGSLGMTGIPAYKVEAACGSGGVALHNAFLAVKSGESEAVLVTGVEKMTDLDGPSVTSALAMADDQEYSASLGLTFISLNAITHRMYLQRFSVSEEEMASFPVLSHKHAKDSLHAMFRNQITVEDVMKSPVISDPIRLLDTAPVCDGAASILVVGESVAKSAPGPLVEVLASEVATNIFDLAERPDPLDYTATRAAVQRVLSRTGRSLGDLDFLELHDAFSVTSALSLESMGICQAGRAAADASRGRFELGGELPVNTFGGLKARGHPVGASGIYQLAEAYLQLTQRAGGCQVKGAKLGLTHNMGGVDTTTAVHLLSGEV
jgi:acetyl-CoA C-acetyltransferase